MEVPATSRTVEELEAAGDLPLCYAGCGKTVRQECKFLDDGRRPCLRTERGLRIMYCRDCYIKVGYHEEMKARHRIYLPQCRTACGEKVHSPTAWYCKACEGKERDPSRAEWLARAENGRLPQCQSCGQNRVYHRLLRFCYKCVMTGGLFCARGESFETLASDGRWGGWWYHVVSYGKPYLRVQRIRRKYGFCCAGPCLRAPSRLADHYRWDNCKICNLIWHRKYVQAASPDKSYLSGRLGGRLGGTFGKRGK